jgi:hypothetical protein
MRCFVDLTALKDSTGENEPDGQSKYRHFILSQRLLEQYSVLKRAGFAMIVLCADVGLPGQGLEARAWLLVHGLQADVLEMKPNSCAFADHIWLANQIGRLPRSIITWFISPDPMARAAVIRFYPGRVVNFASVGQAVAALPGPLKQELGLPEI